MNINNRSKCIVLKADCFTLLFDRVTMDMNYRLLFFHSMLIMLKEYMLFYLLLHFFTHIKEI